MVSPEATKSCTDQGVETFIATNHFLRGGVLAARAADPIPGNPNLRRSRARSFTVLVILCIYYAPVCVVKRVADLLRRTIRACRGDPPMCHDLIEIAPCGLPSVLRIIYAYGDIVCRRQLAGNRYRIHDGRIVRQR